MFNRKKKYNYTPMTDEEIRQSQEKLGIVKPKVQVVKQPQVLYGPPPMREEVVVEMPQVLYGPPPVQEEVVVEQPKAQNNETFSQSEKNDIEQVIDILE